MNLNYIFFPSPRCSYTPKTLKGELIWIPKHKDGIDNSPEENTKLITDYHIRTDHFDINEPKIQNTMYTETSLSQDATDRLFTLTCKLQKKMTLTEIVNPINATNTPLMTPRLSDSFSTEVSPTDHKDELGMIQDESKNFNINNTLHNKNLPKFHRKINGFQNEYKSPKIDDNSLVFEEGIYQTDTSSLKEFKFFKNFINNSKSAKKVGGKDFENVFAENDTVDRIRSPKSLTKMITTKSSNLINYETKASNQNRYATETNIMKSSSLTQISKNTVINSLDIKIASLNHYQKNIFAVRKEVDADFHVSHAKKKKSLGVNTPKIDKIEYYIPCLFLKSGNHTKKIIIYFHGNGEDINLAYDLLNHIRIHLNVFFL